jgi:hypothetical protein
VAHAQQKQDEPLQTTNNEKRALGGHQLQQRMTFCFSRSCTAEEKKKIKKPEQAAGG